MILAIMIGVLTGGGVYLMMQRGMVRVVFGLGLFSHAVNLILLTTGVSAWRTEPLMDSATPAEAADPLPQAFVLTAIVITLAVTVFMLSLAVVSNDDDTHAIPDPGDRPTAQENDTGDGADPAAKSATGTTATTTGQERDA